MLHSSKQTKLSFHAELYKFSPQDTCSKNSSSGGFFSLSTISLKPRTANITVGRQRNRKNPVSTLITSNSL